VVSFVVGLHRLPNSQKIVKPESFQILPKQWNQWNQWKRWNQWASRIFQNSENSELPDSSVTVKTVSFQILPKQWKQWEQFCGLDQCRRVASLTQQSENSKTRELPDSSKAVKTVWPVKPVSELPESSKTVQTVVCFQLLCRRVASLTRQGLCVRG